MTDQPTQDAIVTQRAREFAAIIWRDYVAKVGEVIVARCMRDGELDDGLPSILATYRAEIEAATIITERERIIAHMKWWESQDGDKEGGWLHALIGQIENGEHAIRNLKGQTS